MKAREDSTPTYKHAEVQPTWIQVRVVRKMNNLKSGQAVPSSANANNRSVRHTYDRTFSIERCNLKELVSMSKV